MSKERRAMNKFRVEGYNSGGYHAYRELEFDGDLEYCYYYDARDDYSFVSYIKVTFPDGSVTHKDRDFIQKLLDEQSYIESFLTTGIEKIEANGELVSKNNDLGVIGEKREHPVIHFFKNLWK